MQVLESNDSSLGHTTMISVANSDAQKSTSKDRKQKFHRVDPQANELAQKRLGSRIAKLHFPGGESRRSYRAILQNGESVIVTKRDTIMRSQLECMVLSTLCKADMPVPGVLASDGCWRAPWSA